ncbi:hypothetical protein YC2023_045377 [Brassica napus]
MEPAQHGVQDVLNISTEVHVFHRTRLDLDHARLEKDHVRLEKDHARLEKDHARLDKNHARLDLGRARLSLGLDEPEDRHGFSPGGPSGHSPLDRGYIKSHSASLDDPFNPSQFQKCRLPSRIISNTQLNDRAWLELGRYVATELCACLVAAYQSSLACPRSDFHTRACPRPIWIRVRCLRTIEFLDLAISIAEIEAISSRYMEFHEEGNIFHQNQHLQSLTISFQREKKNS